MARFDRLNNSAPVQTELEKKTSPVGRSAHDFSYIHNGNAIFGALIPVDCFDVVPNEDINISLNPLLEFRNPTVRQLLNSCRVYFHAYYNRLSDLWEGAKNWIDKGRSGKLSLSRPALKYRVGKWGSENFYANASTPMSLLNFLGMPSESMHDSSITAPLYSFKPSVQIGPDSDPVVADSGTVNQTLDYFPADCAMAYQRNWRDFYSPKNLLQENPFWFPDNEEHFIISYDCETACMINYENELPETEAEIFENITGFAPDQTLEEYKALIKVTQEPHCPSSSDIDVSNVAHYSPNLAALKFRQFKGDRFTTALPFPDLIRGDIPVLNLVESHFMDLTNGSGLDPSIGRKSVFDVTTSEGTGDYQETTLRVLSPLGDNPSSGSLGVVSPSVSVTMSDIYTLETLTAFKRRMAMTNGDYNELIEAQFGYNPHVHDRHGTYIGGFYQDFAFSSVTQVSESASTPLGTKAGQGVSSGRGNIGSFHTPDYGWIQIYMSICPDTYYTQGKPRMFSKKSNLEMYFPIFNNLPAQHIRNDELYPLDDADKNLEPFAYEDRYAEYKSRVNRVSGFMALNHSQAAYDAARIMSRRFQAEPKLNNKFVLMIPENIDMEVFSVVDEPPIDFSIGVNVRRVFPGPYTAIEGSLSSPDLMR